jgi:nucleotide-binding universal stress UspA family protein
MARRPSVIGEDIGLHREKKMPGIIVGIDGSTRSRQALEWAVNEAAIRHAPLTVLTVHQALASYWGGPVLADQDLTLRDREAAQEETDSVLEKVGEEARPPSVTVRAVLGVPAEELLLAAEDADLLVVGSRGAGGFKRLLMGSVSSQVAHHAHCPVVVIPADNP